MSCNVNTLLAEGAQFQGLDERGQQMAILQLLCNISESGGGGGGGTTQVFAGSGNPNGVQSATGVALYIDSATGTIYQKTTAGTSNSQWV
jgi:hypothetical protein